MPVRGNPFKEYGGRGSFRMSPPMRTGLATGVCLSFTFALWVVVANRVPQFELFARERNTAAVALLVFFASLPVMRFYRSPSNLLVSGVLGWSLLTITYLFLCVKFVQLDANYSWFHIFVLGSVTYFVFATLSWVGTIIWRVRADDVSHSHH